VDEPPSYTPILLDIFSGLHAVSLSFLVLLLILSAVISACEAAFFTLTPTDLEAFRQSADKRDRDVATLLSKPRVLLVTILILDGLVNVCLITFLALQWWILNDAYNPTVWHVTVILVPAAAFLAFFGEIFPKMLAAPRNKAIARRAAPTWKLFAALCKPVSKPMRRMTVYVERFFEPRSQTPAQELNEAIELASADDATSEGEKEILRGIVNFGTLTAKEIMCARREISAIDIASNFHVLMEHVEKSGFSRIPVYRNSLDTVEGILYIKDLLPFLELAADFNWQSLLRPVFAVPETKKIDALLKDFQEKRVHIAVVVDEHRVTSGLITMEDIIEEIIGDINDEFDEVAIPFQRIGRRSFVFEGKVLLTDFCKTLAIDPGIFSVVAGEAGTLSGLILSLHGELPVVGAQITFEHLTFVVESIDHNRIKRVRVQVHEQA
jgi:gliding motility-associated protein GldE